MFKKLFLLFLTIALFVSCLKDDNETLQCYYSDLGITEANGSSFLTNNGRRINWKVRHSEKFIEIYYFYGPSNGHGEYWEKGHLFERNNNCSKYLLSYNKGFGWYENLLEVRGNLNTNVVLQDWGNNGVFSGKFFNDNSSSNFWVKLDTNSYYNFNNNIQTTKNCIDLVTPQNIDMDGDGITDYQLLKKEQIIGTQQVSSLNNSVNIEALNNNSILKGNTIGILNEIPFSSNNQISNIHESNNILGLLIDFEPPFDRYNFWYSDHHYGINYYYPYFPHKGFANNKDDYILVKLERDGLYYYGWIKIKVNYANCQFEVLETYLNPNPNEHVSVN